MENNNFVLSEKCIKNGPGFPFGVALIRNVQRKQANKQVEIAKKNTLEDIKSMDEEIRSNIKIYDSYFKAKGFDCPLPSQFNRTMSNGFSIINRFVDTMFISEMSTGLLMGAQDYGKMTGKLLYDLAEEGECYKGMRGDVVCQKDELVIRDYEGIIASYFQGADLRTGITKQTQNVLFFGFGAPGINRQAVQNSLEIAISILGSCSEGSELHMI
jgi:DNA/RNA-binding domain of Phe-tRNA-synthetase-like protein